MIVIYRMCGIKSTNPSPILYDNKYALNKLCLKSFINAYKDIKPYIFFIMDHCDYEYKELVQSLMPKGWSYNYEFGNRGINETMLQAYSLALKLKEDVLFAECDHLWRPDIGSQVVEAIKEFDLLSTYDHPDLYTRYDIHQKESEIKILNDNHYRTATRNVMTFGITYEALKKNIHILRKYGYLDDKVWGELAANGYQLHVPIPSISTHMVEGLLAPSVDWEKIWKEFI